MYNLTSLNSTTYDYNKLWIFQTFGEVCRQERTHVQSQRFIIKYICTCKHYLMSGN